MTVLHLLDTNMVGYIVRGHSPVARARLLAPDNGNVRAISAITEAEIRYGLAKRPHATALDLLMSSFLASIQVLPWSRNEAAAYGHLRAELEPKGIALGCLDMMIAAHAIAVGATLVTNDKAFAQGYGLFSTVNWATDLTRSKT